MVRRISAASIPARPFRRAHFGEARAFRRAFGRGEIRAGQ
jgi:hypothetical protein